jgi:transcriptional regulator with XRE-family HTH domain
MNDSRRISAAIKALRNKLGDTQAGMAHRLGVSLRTYDRWEAGHTIPRGDILVKILALCADAETRALFDAAGSRTPNASGKPAASSSARPSSPEDRLRTRFRNSCLAAIEIIYESAVLGSAAADEKLRSYVDELNREAVILAEGLLEAKRPARLSLRQNGPGKAQRNQASQEN